ncbi:MAG: hypothetical protein NTV94_07100 [Planctomycetota bacterium]|nr:hypothetical protein [Planctomycetota bacterium]
MSNAMSVVAGLGWVSCWTLAGLSVASSGGCAGGSPPPVMADQPYAGPAVKLESSGGVWIVVVRSPSPGWKAHVDRLWEEYGAQGVYVSLTEPNPAFSYASVEVEQRLATSVRAADPVKLYVQRLKFTLEPAGAEGYSFAGDAGLAPKP